MKTTHTVNVMSVKTANKEGKKYLSKNGEQAWRVSLKIGEEWYGNMIYDETFIPKKGSTITIELTENDGFKNWDYATLTKKEQIKAQVEPDKGYPSDEEILDILDTKPTPKPLESPRTVPQTSYDDGKQGRGASLNMACNYQLYKAMGGTLDLDKWLNENIKNANIIAPLQHKFVNNI